MKRFWILLGSEKILLGREKILLGREKINKYLDFVRELKKLWKMRVTVILIVVSALGAVTNGLNLGN